MEIPCAIYPLDTAISGIVPKFYPVSDVAAPPDVPLVIPCLLFVLVNLLSLIGKLLPGPVPAPSRGCRICSRFPAPGEPSRRGCPQWRPLAWPGSLLRATSSSVTPPCPCHPCNLTLQEPGTSHFQSHRRRRRISAAQNESDRCHALKGTDKNTG